MRDHREASPAFDCSIETRRFRGLQSAIYHTFGGRRPVGAKAGRQALFPSYSFFRNSVSCVTGLSPDPPCRPRVRRLNHVFVMVFLGSGALSAFSF